MHSISCLHLNIKTMKNETFQNDFQKFRYFIFKGMSCKAEESRKYHTFKNFAVSPN